MIHPDGNIWMVDVVESSGSGPLDKAGSLAFRGGFVRPFPDGEPQAEIIISLHYVLAHRHDQPVAAGYTPVLSKSPFTIMNDPVKSPILETMLQRTCTGTVHTNDLGDTPPDSIFGNIYRVTAVFYRKPDGTPWVKWSTDGDTVNYLPVTELGVSAQWCFPFNRRRGPPLHYAVWPAGDNHLNGRTVQGPGTIDLACDSVMVPVTASNPLLEPH